MTNEMRGLTDHDRIRYSRHLRLPGFSDNEQANLKEASVLVVGAGGLGSPALLYLTAAGIGRIGIVDDDRVDLSNLQRQIVHSEESIGRPKIDSAAEQVRRLNGACQVITHPYRLTSENAIRTLSDYDLVVDGSDNLPTRYLVNDACVLTRRPLIYGSVFQYEGQVAVFGAPDGPCYRCLFPSPPPPELVPSCQDAGVLGIVPGIVGCYQTLEAIKMLTGVGDTLVGKLLLLDFRANRHQVLEVAKDRHCPVCGEDATIDRLIDYEAFCGIERAPSISCGEVRSMLLSASADLLLVDVRNENERSAGNIGGHHFPMVDLEANLENIRQLAGTKEIVTYCRSGVRSAAATNLLLANGFDTVRSMRGGLVEWQQSIDSNLHVA